MSNFDRKTFSEIRDAARQIVESRAGQSHRYQAAVSFTVHQLLFACSQDDELHLANDDELHLANDDFHGHNKCAWLVRQIEHELAKYLITIRGEHAEQPTFEQGALLALQFAYQRAYELSQSLLS